MRPADPQPVPTSKLDLDLAVADRVAFGLGSGMTHDPDWQETGCLRRRLRHPRREAPVTHPFADQIGIEPMARRATCAIETTEAVV